eukprot:scaffold132096_cov18-Tisochrysis_lutea.AAC.1
MASCTSLQQNLRQGWQTREQTQGWQSALASNTSGYEDVKLHQCTHALARLCALPMQLCYLAQTHSGRPVESGGKKSTEERVRIKVQTS